MIVGPIVKLIFKGYERTLAGLVSAILSVVDTKLAGQTSVVKIRERIGILLAALNDAITRVLKGQYTEALAIDDRNRDTLYRAFIYRLESDMLCTYNPTLQENARILYNILEQNDRILKDGYLDESNQLENLFIKYTEHADLLRQNGIQELYDHLVAAQNKFQKTWQMSSESTANKKEIPQLRDAANDLIDAVNKSLFGRINLESDEIGEPFLSASNVINELVEKTHKLQRSRIARNDTTDEPVSAKEEKASVTA
jgi:hypothetical protein